MAHVFQLVKNFTGTVAALVDLAAAALGTTAGSLAPDRNGLLITTNAGANKAYGLWPQASALLIATGFQKPADQALLKVKIKTPHVLTSLEYLIGLFDQLPDAAVSSGKTNPGEYNNADLVFGAWFWYDQTGDAGKLCVGYRDTTAEINVAKVATAITLAIDTEYELQVAFTAAGVPQFTVDGVLVHTGEALTTNTAVLPGVFAVGNAATLYVREVLNQKVYA